MARIVIAEDEAYVRNMLATWMSRHGHEVIGAPNGRIALEFLKAQPVDLLITDINMPDISGIELIRSAFTSCPTLQRVFVVTSRCDQQEIASLVADPRVSIFLKPFSPTRLLRAVEQVATASGVRGLVWMPPATPPAVRAASAGEVR